LPSLSLRYGPKTTGETEKAFDDLGNKIMDAKAEYETVKGIRYELFGEEFEVGMSDIDVRDVICASAFQCGSMVEFH